MKRSARRAVLAGLASAAVMTSLTVGATSASAIGSVNCGPEFLKVSWRGVLIPVEGTNCYANAGEMSFSVAVRITKIVTGNNRVQWYANGRWQPEPAIGKWTPFTAPGSGVYAERIRIL